LPSIPKELLDKIVPGPMIEPQSKTLRSSITAEDECMSRVAPIKPGDLLREEFLVPMGISQYRLSKEISVPAQRIGEIVAGRRSITADTDLRLCRFFGLSSGYWLRAQAAHDTEVVERELAPVLQRIRPWAMQTAEDAPRRGRA
jgi:addiction module HigA family antidote